MYHTGALTTDGELYTWGRGLYGVLGNGSNQYSLEPELNEELKILREENPEKEIVKIDSADEYTACLMKDGSLYVWGKNDRGQMGTGTGIGIDMVESESIPIQVNVIDEKTQQPMLVKDFHPGTNTMLIQDVNNNVYKTGLRLDYSPKQLNFFEEFNKDDVT